MPIARSRGPEKPPVSQRSPRQDRALIELRVVRERLQLWDGPALDVPSKLIRAYSRAMHRACRNGLAAHPEVEIWIKAQRAVGAWESLRRARLGDVKKPMSPAEAELFEWVACCLDRESLRRASPTDLAKIQKHMRPAQRALFRAIVHSSDVELSSWTQIQRLLERLGIIGNISREEFNRRLETLGLKEPEPSRRRAMLGIPAMFQESRYGTGRTCLPRHWPECPGASSQSVSSSRGLRSGTTAMPSCCTSLAAAPNAIPVLGCGRDRRSISPCSSSELGKVLGKVKGATELAPS